MSNALEEHIPHLKITSCSHIFLTGYLSRHIKVASANEFRRGIVH